MPSGSRDKARIIDIALQAGVSTATVDRVLNHRPGVRRKTADRVAEAIRWLEKAPARPTIIPSLRADLTVDVIIAGNAGFSNDALAAELRREGAEHGLTLRPAYPLRLDPYALAAALTESHKKGSSGFIVQALDHPIVRDAIGRICKDGIPVVTILTSLPGAPTLGYIGLDNRAAGRTAGLLMGRLCREPGEIAIFWGGNVYRSHEEREIGFCSVIREEFQDLRLLAGCQGQDDPQKNYEMAKHLLETNRSLRGIYNVGSGNRGIEKALIESGLHRQVNYVAFNLTPLTRQGLLTGVIDAVVHQDMAHAAKYAIEALVNNFLGKAPLFPAVPVEIIMRENIR